MPQRHGFTRKVFFSIFTILLFYLSSDAQNKRLVTFGSLLEQMTNNDQLARYPQPFYRQLEASSYNRASESPFKPGWFADGDGSGYIRTDSINGRKEYVIMEHHGPGCITRIWTPYFYNNLNNHTGPDIAIYLDGSKVPVLKENFIQLLTGRSFVHPPFADLTTRAGVLYLPIPFSKSCIITLSEKPFYYCVSYRVYPAGTPVRSFSMKAYKYAGHILQQAAFNLTHPSPVRLSNTKNISKNVLPGDSLTLALHEEMHAIKYLKLTLNTPVSFGLLRNILLKMTFDDQQTVWCPLGDFFCSADTLNKFHTRFLQVNGEGSLICRWIMPYHYRAVISLVNFSGKTIKISVEAQIEKWYWDQRSMYFHADWCDYGYLPGNKFFDLNFITLKGKGIIAGDALTVLSPGTGWWGEGDEKIYIDEEDIRQYFPSQFGTGTEDYYGWAGGVIPTGKDIFSLPFCSNVRNGNSLNPRGYNICIRNRMLDAIPFDDALKFDMEASPGVDIRHYYNLLAYSMVTYWYGLPGATSNRIPLIKKMKQKLMKLSTLDTLEEKLRTGRMHLDDHNIDVKVKSLGGFP